MARIGIFTISDSTNIGNRLQNFALTSVLRKRGHDVVSIANTPFRFDAPQRAHIDDAVPKPPSKLAKTQARLRWAMSLLDGWPRRKARLRIQQEISRHALAPSLESFTAEYIPTDERRVTSLSSGRALESDFDLFIAGSDQIWNPHYRGGCPNDFLAFADEHKRIAYAASYGVAEIPESMRGHFAAQLSAMSSLSVREFSAQTIVRELTGLDAPVVLDPTLLLDTCEWSTVADRAPKPSRKPYVAKYLLSDDATGNVSLTKNFAESRGLRVVDILNPPLRHMFKHRAESFVRSIRDADYVVTDSFHATVFAILFGVPFTVFTRGAMNTRLDSLLTLCGSDVAKFRELPPTGEEHSHAVAPTQLLAQKEDSLRYLDAAIADALAVPGRDCDD